MTDRSIQRNTDLGRAIDFGKGDGLVPTIVQDSESGDVLMLGYTDRLALETSLRTGRMHFWSRSRGAQWMKGETSGNTLALDSLHADCDGDAILARVHPSGPTCHTGERSCFGDGTTAADGAYARPADGQGPDRVPAAPGAGVLGRLDSTLQSRAEERPEGSYTVRLLDDANLRLKKLGEESAELIAALAGGEPDRAVDEAADLVYHVLVALRAEGIGVARLLEELEVRAG